MRKLFTYSVHRLSFLFFIFFILLSAPKIEAQDVLAGLTSNGGPEGRGTAFSIKTSGTSFSIIKGFADWGKTPWGDLVKGADGNFYGMTSIGGTYNAGTIFKATPAGVITVLHHLNYATEGANPYGELTIGADGNFYGITSSGGTTSHGTIFKITPVGIFTVIRHLSQADGSGARGHLVIGADGNFYGCTYAGGANGYGTIFKMTPTGTFTVLRSLSPTTDGAYCYGSLVKGTDNNFYGTTNGGGTSGNGTIFKITPTGTYTVLRQMTQATDGTHSQSDLIQGTDGNFYGMAYGGGPNFNGTIFKISSTGTFTLLKSLVTANGAGPYGNLLQGTDGNFYGMASGGGASGGGTVFKITPTGTLTVLHSFISTTEGSSPRGSLIKGADGNYYGMTNNGGSNFFGTLFKITPTGTFSVLTKFNGATEGNAPYQTLVKGIDSAYYGTTSSGGIYNYGTIFKICGGILSTLHSFNRTVDGAAPKGSLIQATDKNFYGMTSDGGTGGVGTIFKISSTGTFTLLKHLASSADGSKPYGSLVQAGDGNFYGMTSAGGTGNVGTIFKVTSAGVFSVIRHLVSATDGANPQGDLVKGTDGNLYGMTYSNCRIFKITTAGSFTVIHTLASATEGSYPTGSLVLGADGKFYATASSGGNSNAGLIFKVTTTGTLTVLRKLTAAADGSIPKGNLVKGYDGNFYGMTNMGGTNNVGTIFKITSTGTYTVLRHLNMATDGGNAFGSLILAPINKLVANPQSTTTKEDIKKTITLTGSGGTPLTFTVVTKPLHGSISTGTSASRSYTPTKNYSGSDLFTFTANLGCLSSAPATVNISITPVNDTPVLTHIGNKTIVKGSKLSFTATATDVDAGQTRTFSLISAPVGATINATSGVFAWTPTATGTFTFKVRVTDNGSPILFDEEQITVSVTATFVNSVTLNNELPTGNLNAEHTAVTIYPNPAKDKIILSLNAQAYCHAIVYVTDLSGHILSTKKYNAIKNNAEINISQLKPGMYLLQVQNGHTSQTLKFFKAN